MLSHGRVGITFEMWVSLIYDSQKVVNTGDHIGGEVGVETILGTAEPNFLKRLKGHRTGLVAAVDAATALKMSHSVGNFAMYQKSSVKLC